MTGWVIPSKVQGESFEVGAKVTYDGNQMIIQAVYSDGDIKMQNLSAIFALCAALPKMRALIELKCAAMPC